MSLLDAAKAGIFDIDASLRIHRLGYGAMRIMGEGFWGEPADRDGIIALLGALPGLGVNFIDTADSYGPAVSERLIREALHPYDGILVATKAGMVRRGPFRWKPLCDPDYLVQQAHLSRERLDVSQIGLWQLHRVDPNYPRDEQFDAVRSLVDDGVIAHVGLSEVTIEDIQAASAYFKVATVQNRFNLHERHHEPVLRYCEQNGIGFIPYFPLGSGGMLKSEIALKTVAKRHGATPAQIGIAWLLHLSPVMLPIPGTSSLAHLKENMAAADVALSPDDLDILNNARSQVE